MPAKHSRSRDLSFVVSILVAQGPWQATSQAHAQGAQVAPTQRLSPSQPGFFEGRDLDFWREGKRVSPAVPEAAPVPRNDELPPPTGSIIRQRDSLPFDWSRYEDPAHPEFWDDGGDYVPPRPLREAVVNPTKENLERYVSWQAKRIAVATAFSEKLAAHALSQGGMGSLAARTPARGPLQASARAPGTSLSAPDIRWREVEILYFYQSNCPHCQAEYRHVEAIKSKGARVSFIQLDAGERPPLHVGSVAYTKAHSDQFGISATPTWIVRRREKVMRLQGRQDERLFASQVATLFAPETDAKPERVGLP